jgi:16S rRNA (uracil1498-N3)-methyltransferase
MNLLLLKTNQLSGQSANNLTAITGRQLQQLIEVQRCTIGDTVRVGEIGGLMGTGTIIELNTSQALLEIKLHRPAPPPAPLTLILAMPRPKMLRRSLQTIAAMGVKQIYLINSYRVEKSFWQTPFLKPEAIEEEFILGLEQARDTTMPELYIRKRFKPFVEDELPAIIKGRKNLLAHPVTETRCPIDIQQPATLAIGPEGGFIPYEVELLNTAGFETVHIGPRILRVETAVPALISRLFPA